MNATKKTVSHAKTSAGQVLQIDVALIDVDAQVRTVFNDETIAQLAADIRDNGVLQPLVVRPNGNRYTLLIGERRLRAIRYNGGTTAPAIVADVADQLANHAQLMENIQREDLNTKDLAGAIKTLWDKHGSVAAVAAVCHKSPSWVSKRLALALASGESTIALLNGNVKDVDLIYQFVKLEKTNPKKARALVTPILLGMIGRQDVIDHLLDNEDAPVPPMPTEQKTQQSEAQTGLFDIPADAIGAAPTPEHIHLMAENATMRLALEKIAGLDKSLRPLDKANRMRAIAIAAIEELTPHQHDAEDANQPEKHP
ncbi:MAG: ParB/RepB/Spo0J family partition protein [Gallionella sp.]|nr:ParB/RepB/Spo0J family partition protein [Gallionella sp.]